MGAPVTATPPASGMGDQGAPNDGAGATTDAGTSLSADGGPPAARVTSGTIGFHLLLGVSGSSAPGDTLNLAGDNYTDLIASNIIAGVMYGHLIRETTPNMGFDRDYLYGSIFGQLLQENLDTELYSSSSNLIDPSPLQQAVMGTGQGGP